MLREIPSGRLCLRYPCNRVAAQGPPERLPGHSVYSVHSTKAHIHKVRVHTMSHCIKPRGDLGRRSKCRVVINLLGFAFLPRTGVSPTGLPGHVRSFLLLTAFLRDPAVFSYVCVLSDRQ